MAAPAIAELAPIVELRGRHTFEEWRKGVDTMVLKNPEFAKFLAPETEKKSNATDTEESRSEAIKYAWQRDVFLAMIRDSLMPSIRDSVKHIESPYLLIKDLERWLGNNRCGNRVRQSCKLFKLKSVGDKKVPKEEQVDYMVALIKSFTTNLPMKPEPYYYLWATYQFSEGNDAARAGMDAILERPDEELQNLSLDDAIALVRQAFLGASPRSSASSPP